MARVDHVRQIDEGAYECAGDEAELHGEREPTGARRIELPFALQDGHDRRRAEPQRHAEQLSEREQYQHAPTRATSFSLFVVRSAHLVLLGLMKLFSSCRQLYKLPTALAV